MMIHHVTMSPAWLQPSVTAEKFSMNSNISSKGHVDVSAPWIKEQCCICVLTNNNTVKTSIIEEEGDTKQSSNSSLY